MNKIVTAYSTKGNVYEAVKDIQLKAGFENPKAVLFFASTIYPVDELAKVMKDAFQNSVVFGCTTAGEFVDDKMLKQSLVAMAFSEEVFEEIHFEVIENIGTKDNIDQAMSNFENYYGESILGMDFYKYFGFVLFDGLSAAEEKVMALLGAKTNVLFVGGSAGDDLKFKTTWVFAEGKAYTNAAVLVLVKAGVAFSFIKTQSFKLTDNKLIATKVDELTRTVMEFNGKPAVQEYARVLGVAADSITEKFMSNPLALVIKDEPFVRSPQQVDGESIRFYCQILEGMEMTVLQATSIVEDTKKAVEKAKAAMGHISGIVNFHCILRTLELESKKQEFEYGAIFKGVPTIGFSTYGEEYLGHINQTSTMIVFK